MVDVAYERLLETIIQTCWAMGYHTAILNKCKLIDIERKTHTKLLAQVMEERDVALRELLANYVNKTEGNNGSRRTVQP